MLGIGSLSPCTKALSWLFSQLKVLFSQLSILIIYWKPSWFPNAACITDPAAAPPTVPKTIPISWHLVPATSSSPQICAPSKAPINPPAVAPIQSLSPLILTGKEVLIVPYSTAVTFWASVFWTIVGEVLEHE